MTSLSEPDVPMTTAEIVGDYPEINETKDVGFDDGVLGVSDNARAQARRLANELADHLEIMFMRDNAENKTRDHLVSVYNALYRRFSQLYIDTQGAKIGEDKVYPHRPVYYGSKIAEKEEQIFYPPYIASLKTRGNTRLPAKESFGPNYVFFYDDDVHPSLKESTLVVNILAELRDSLKSPDFRPLKHIMTNAQAGCHFRQSLYLYIIERLKCYCAIPLAEYAEYKNTHPSNFDIGNAASDKYGGEFMDYVKLKAQRIDCSDVYRHREACFRLIEDRLTSEFNELIRYLHSLSVVGGILVGQNTNQHYVLGEKISRSVNIALTRDVIRSYSRGKDMDALEANLVPHNKLTVSPKRKYWGTSYHLHLVTQYRVPAAVVEYKSSYRLLPRAVYNVPLDLFTEIDYSTTPPKVITELGMGKVSARVTKYSDFGLDIEKPDELLPMPVNPHIRNSREGGGGACLGGYSIELQNALTMRDWDAIGLLLKSYHHSYDDRDPWGRSIYRFPRVYETKPGCYVYKPNAPYWREMQALDWSKESFTLGEGPSEDYVYYRGKRVLTHEDWVRCAHTRKIIRRDSAIRLPIYVSEEAVRKLSKAKAHSITNNIADLLRLDNIRETLWAKLRKKNMPKLYMKALAEENNVNKMLADLKRVQMTGHADSWRISAIAMESRAVCSERIRRNRKNHKERQDRRRLVD